MNIFYWALVLTLGYMETVYHISITGLKGINPLLIIPAIFMVAGLETSLLSVGKRTISKVNLWCIQVVNFLLFVTQLLYMRIFTQPLLLAAVINAGGAALTNYWREVLYAIGQNIVFLLLLAVPLFGTGLLLHGKREFLHTEKKGSIQRAKSECRIRGGFSLGLGLLLLCVILFVGQQKGFDYYEDYQSFYDPELMMEKYGVLVTVQRDLLEDDILPESKQSINSSVEASVILPDTTISGNGTVVGSTEESKEQVSNQQEVSQPQLGISQIGLPQVLPVDMDKLKELATDEKLSKLVTYMESRMPTTTNEYTGMFEGYNLIYLTAEGFSPYAVSEELTPTLYQLSNEGFVAENYYVPLWQTSTSDGEYVNLTGQIPYKQFSMKRSADNTQPFSLPAYFAMEGAKSYAYHNNSISYYDRYLTHPNLGYDFKGIKLGGLSEKEWGSQIFEMEHADYWPSSDLDMMHATLPEYINDDIFHVYYMTISGHMNYNFKGNRMSSENKEAVTELPYSEEGRAYIACNIELEKALEYLITELEKAGKLDNTVIALSADHYPYAMDIKNYEELAGQELANSLDLYRNTLILWNSTMTKPVTIEKPCGAMDLLPTLYNLFGFNYDSRLFAGTDMLSDTEGLVIFSDRSFITNDYSYNKKTGEVLSRNGEEVNQELVEQTKQRVKQLYEYSNGILTQNFFNYVDQAIVQ